MKLIKDTVLLDCTLRDGGYHNSWDFRPELIRDYLAAMKAIQIDVVELGFRFLMNQGFKGPCAFTTDDFLLSLAIPDGLTVGVMINGADLCTEIGCIGALDRLFPHRAEATPVDLVRIACHFNELEHALPAAAWLAERGYRVGFNLMQIADRSRTEVTNLARMARDWPIEVLYFADSMGSMTPDDTSRIVGWLRDGWEGPLGIHTHDNMGLAIPNTLRAQTDGVSWLDATVTGMGRGPGNARTEELVIEAEAFRDRKTNFVPLMGLIRSHLGPMKSECGWGTNPYYYLAGKFGIHPTYIQEMLNDTRYEEGDILAVINNLRDHGGKNFSFNKLLEARQSFPSGPSGNWAPATQLEGREVLVLGTGPGTAAHSTALESYIRRARPVVIALNTQEAIDPTLIDLRAACHPVRLLADAETHARQSQPLITPVELLPEGVLAQLGSKTLLDFGLRIERNCFDFSETSCTTPVQLVLAYALAVATSGRATRILIAGLDGYPSGDLRNDETDKILDTYRAQLTDQKLLAVTPTRHRLPSISIYSREI